MAWKVRQMLDCCILGPERTGAPTLGKQVSGALLWSPPQPKENENSEKFPKSPGELSDGMD